MTEKCGENRLNYTLLKTGENISLMKHIKTARFGENLPFSGKQAMFSPQIS
jgi:hypothetical protein